MLDFVGLVGFLSDNAPVCHSCGKKMSLDVPEGSNLKIEDEWFPIYFKCLECYWTRKKLLQITIEFKDA